MELRILAAMGGLLLIAVVLWDVYSTVIRPMRGAKHAIFVRIVVRLGWRLCIAALRLTGRAERRDSLQFYGPLSFVLTLAPWAFALILAFALLHWALGTQVLAPEKVPTFGSLLYMSGVTFFTLGFGDVTPLNPVGRLLAVIEAGTGYAFMALIIAYVPFAYQAIHLREAPLARLDGQAGSPPTAAEFLLRLGQDAEVSAVGSFFQEWEHWVAELMQSHLSYPIIAYSRSESESRTWLDALTMLLDTSALVIVGVGDAPVRPARLFFTLALECTTGLCEVLGISPRSPTFDRLPPAKLDRLRALLREAGAPLREGRSADEELTRLRGLYEPYLAALGDHLAMPIPPWVPPGEAGEVDRRSEAA